MIVNHILGHVLLLVFPVGITIFFFWLFLMKLKWSEKSLSLAILPGAIIWLMLWSNFTLDLIVVDNQAGVEHSMVFFAATYNAPDGQEVEVRKAKSGIGSDCDVYIVNCSEINMALESIGYGTSPLMFFGTGPQIIPPHRTLMENDVPDYFPNEFPPGSVSVTNGITSDSRDWLRTAKDEEVRDNEGIEYYLVPIQ